MTDPKYMIPCGRLRAQGRSPRGRAMDVMIAATALTLDVPLVTRNTHDVDRLGVELLQLTHLPGLDTPLPPRFLYDDYSSL